MILAPVAAQREAELRALLDSMNHAPGRVDPENALVPFARLEQVHFARIVIIDDPTLDDVRAYGITPRTYPLSLAFMGDIDGDADAFLAELASRFESGLRALYACCADYGEPQDLLAWLRAHLVQPATAYGNRQGRTMRQVREEAALYDALQRRLGDGTEFAGQLPVQVHGTLRAFADQEVAAGRLTLTPDAPTPLGWQLRNAAHLIGVPLVLLLLSPLLLVIGIVLAIRLRQLETTDPIICPRITLAQGGELATIEDYDVTNQFTALGSLKPGLVRRWIAMFVLLIIEYTARHLFTRGHLARVQSIHFARWVWLNGKERLMFCSSYDGSLDSYNDDFINKAGFGLDVVFSHGIGYPRTNWLVLDGADDEQKFKYYLRRHQIPSQVWYNGHPGLTAYDLARNARIRAALFVAQPSADDARALLAEL